MASRGHQNPSYTIVIKLGSSSIVHETTHQILLSKLSSVVETVVDLRSQGHRVILVSSGAIAVGLKRMKMASKPKSLSGKQALAAIGQGRLIALWDNLFGQLGQPIAQVLLTRGDISDRTRYLNAVNTFQELLSMGVVPIVNENDTLSVSEIKFGDNDTLSAITSSMLHADFLFLLTDVDGLYTSNPRKYASARLLEVVDSVSAIRSQISTKTLGSSLGTGGMETKLIAAEIATAAGVTTVILSSNHPQNILHVIRYNNRNSLKMTTNDPSNEETTPTLGSESANPSSPISMIRPPHTVFTASTTPMRDLKAWTAHTLFPSGSVIIDSGAHLVLSRRESGGRLLAAGVVGVIGAFASGQAVRIVIRKPSPSDIDSASARATEYVKGTDTPRPMTPSVLRRAGSAESQSSSDLSSSLVETGVGLSKAAMPSVEGDLVVAPLSVERDLDADVVEVGRGLANYNSEQILRVRGVKSSDLPQILGYADSEYVVENITIKVPPA